MTEATRKLIEAARPLAKLGRTVGNGMAAGLSYSGVPATQLRTLSEAFDEAEAELEEGDDDA